MRIAMAGASGAWRVWIGLVLLCCSSTVARGQTATDVVQPPPKDLETTLPAAYLKDPVIRNEVEKLRQLRSRAEGFGVRHPAYARVQESLRNAELKLQTVVDARLLVDLKNEVTESPFPKREQDSPEKDSPRGLFPPGTDTESAENAFDPAALAPDPLGLESLPDAQGRYLEDRVPAHLMRDPAVSPYIEGLRRLRNFVRGLGPNHPAFPKSQRALREWEAYLQRLIEFKSDII